MLCKFILIHLDKYYLYSVHVFFLNMLIHTYIYIYTHYTFIVYLSIYLIWSDLIYLYRNKYLHNYIYIYISWFCIYIYIFIYTHTYTHITFAQLHRVFLSTSFQPWNRHSFDSWFREGAPFQSVRLVGAHCEAFLLENGWTRAAVFQDPFLNVLQHLAKEVLRFKAKAIS